MAPCVMSSDGGFVLVKKKSRSSKGTNINAIKHEGIGDLAEHSQEEVEQIKRRLGDAVLDVRASEFYRLFRLQLSQLLTKFDDVDRVESLVCLGLGRVTSCVVARTQLAFVVVIKEDLGVHVKVFDPAFSSSDKQLLSSLDGVSVLPSNSEAKLRLDSAALVYLPHCPKQLSNNLLWANWNPKSIRRAFVLANSFARIVETAANLEQEARFVSLVSSFVCEAPLSNCYRFEDVFNDTSLHVFPAPPDSDWTHWAEADVEPVYEDDDAEYLSSGKRPA